MNEKAAYDIRLSGHLDSRWADWFDGCRIDNTHDGTVVIHGPALDQAALQGLLQKVRDIGLPLVSVIPVDSAPHTHHTDTGEPT